MPFITRTKINEVFETRNILEEPIGYGKYVTYISGLQPGATGLFTQIIRPNYQIFNCNKFYPTAYLKFHSIPPTGLPLADLYLNPCGTGNTPYTSGIAINPKDYIGTLFGYCSSQVYINLYLSDSGRKNIGLDLDNFPNPIESGYLKLPPVETTESFGLIMVNRSNLQIATGYVAFYRDSFVVRDTLE